MNDALSLDDLETYAQYLGLGSDFEAFYEIYYGLVEDENIEELTELQEA